MGVVGNFLEWLFAGKVRSRWELLRVPVCFPGGAGKYWEVSREVLGVSWYEQRDAWSRIDKLNITRKISMTLFDFARFPFICQDRFYIADSSQSGIACLIK